MMTNSVLSYGKGKVPTKREPRTYNPYRVVPWVTLCFFDNWEAILLEREMIETLVWRHQRGDFLIVPRGRTSIGTLF